MTFSNVLTVLRGIAAIAFVPLILIDSQISRGFAVAAFALAAITDYFDGKLARERHEKTDFGILADPIADKLLTGVCFISISWYMPEVVPWWMTIVILCREVGITAYRLVKVKQGRIVGADRWGKWKTALQMSLIPYALVLIAVFSGERGNEWHRALLEQPYGMAPFWFGYGFAFVTTALTLYSGAQILKKSE